MANALEEIGAAGVSAADKVKWMQDASSHQKEITKTADFKAELNGIGISAAQKAKWLLDPASHQKEIARATENAQAELAAVGISAADRAKWLEDPATHRKEITHMANALEEIGAAGVSAAARANLIQNQNHNRANKEQVKVSRSAALDKKKWLESAFKKDKEEEVEVKEEKESKVKNVASIFGGTKKDEKKPTGPKPKTAFQLRVEALKEKERLEQEKKNPPPKKKVWRRPSDGNAEKLKINVAPKKSLSELP